MAEAHTRAPSSFRAEELPDGACISPKHVNRPGLAGTKDPQNTVIREAEVSNLSNPPVKNPLTLLLFLFFFCSSLSH